MKPSLVAMTIIFGIILPGAVAGIYAGFRRKMNLERWTVSGRGFGLILVWLLMAGEVYTTFALLGASGWAYSHGGSTLYIIAYLSLCYVISFFILPGIWEVGRKYSLHTQSDFFRQRYGSTPLSALMAVVGLRFIIPLPATAAPGLRNHRSGSQLSRPVSITIAFVIVAGFVLSSGIRAVAWVSVLNDSLMLIAALCIGVPYHCFAGHQADVSRTDRGQGTVHLKRTREIGIRSALGASPVDILRLVVRQGMTLSVLGIGMGLSLAVAASRAIASLLYGVSSLDPVTCLVVIALLLSVSGMACWIPARRAAQVDPSITLRAE